MSLIRARQPIVTRVFPHQANRRYIKTRPAPAGALSALYNYFTSAAPPQNPAPGVMNHGTAALIVYLNRVDANGRDVGSGLLSLVAGDSVTVGVQSGVLASVPFMNAGQYVVLSFVAFPNLVNGQYLCTAKRAGT